MFEYRDISHADDIVKKILVTGGYGFIGSRLIEVLATQPLMQVTASIRTQRMSRPQSVFKFVEMDLSQPTDWRAHLDGIDVIVHTAAKAHQLPSANKDSRSFWQVNHKGTLTLAQQAAAQGVKRFIFLSTIKVNGESTQPREVFRASDTPSPSDPYGQSKLEAEIQLQALSASTGMEVVIIRPPLVYGPGVKANFHNLISWLHRGIPLPLAAINNKRSLLGLDNLISLIITCIEHPAAAGNIFMVSDNQDLSTPQLLQEVAHALNQQARLFSLPESVLRMAAKTLGKEQALHRLCTNLQVDISPTQRILNWQPTTTIQQELHKTVQAYLEKKPS